MKPLWETIAAFGFLLLCLGIIRSLAVRYSPQEGAGEEKQPP
ncbi:MAG: hypothetical protein PHG54_04685 [Smithellaceae bacterium]|jgi:hypothetical protein|nr:hypothetical protein [Smithellaceae bacterium]